MSEIFSCPKCGFRQMLSDSCPRCGIVFSKYEASQSGGITIKGIEKRIEKSLDQYFQSSPTRELDEALVAFQGAKKRYVRWLFFCFALCGSGISTIFIFRTTGAFLTGVFIFLLGMALFIIGAFILYKCPLCGQTLMIGPEEGGGISTDSDRAIHFWPPPDICPHCNFELK